MRQQASKRTRRRPDAYHQLRESIVSGQFHPNERLVEATIARRIGAGRTAVRSALERLDQEGLVTLERNRGARVRLISDREALEIEQVRAALEGMMARRAATRILPEQLRELHDMLERMRARVEEGDSIGYSELNATFHQVIWAAADHPLGSRLLGSLKSQGIRFQYQTALRPGRAKRSLGEHQAIFAALKAHDEDGAEAAMRQHLAEVLETLQWAIDSQHRTALWLPG
jgi:DNA-binding GntR family transcriptional regulator